MRLGQMRLGQMRLGQMRLGQMRLGQMRLCALALRGVALVVAGKGATTMATPRKADATRSLPRTLAGVPQACRERRRAARLVRSPLSAGFSGP